MTRIQPNDPRGEAGLPPRFVQRLTAIVAPGQIESCLRAMQERPQPTVRINTLRYDVDTVSGAMRDAGFELTALPWRDDAFSLPRGQREALTHSDFVQTAQVYLQNPSSMLPPMLLAPHPSDWILDLTAAPGSKTHQLACAMDNRGRISAVEAVRKRYFKLKQNLDTLGVTNTRTYLKDGTIVWRACPEQFDRVLLDAPCSSEGQFVSHDPNTYRYWSEKKIKEMSRKQKRLLYSAIQSLKPGGVLVYSTCTFAPEENELVIAHLLRRFAPALRVEPIELSLSNSLPGLEVWAGRTIPEELRSARRILPDGLMEGFFVCKLRKQASTLGRD